MQQLTTRAGEVEFTPSSLFDTLIFDFFFFLPITSKLQSRSSEDFPRWSGVSFSPPAIFEYAACKAVQVRSPFFLAYTMAVPTSCLEIFDCKQTHL